MTIPHACPPVSTLWPITLGDAIDRHARSMPDARYLKRMRIAAGSGSSLARFIVAPPESRPRLSAAARAAAVQRRKEYVADPEICEPCNRRVIYKAQEASCVCTRCGNSATFQDPDTSYREGTSLHVPYLYKQENHFRDHLKRIQGKESTDIPDDVIAAIVAELNKRGNDRSRVTPDDIRHILKCLGKSKLYNHTVRIWSMATGRSPPVLTSHQEQELLHMFRMIRDPWMKTRPKNRSNMLSYTYLLNKMCNLLGYTEVASCFKLLKSRDKLLQQDRYWKRICDELEFDYERSVR